MVDRRSPGGPQHRAEWLPADDVELRPLPTPPETIPVVPIPLPDDPSPGAVRRYLRQFLSDPRVVEIPRPVWLMILYGFILPFRPKRSAEAYEKIWTEDGSPLLRISEDITRSLRDKLKQRFSGPVHAELGMSYGSPSIPAALDKLYAAGARRIVVLPLYPQYSGTTTGSVFDAVTRALSRRRWVPELRFINHYHDARGYIASLAASVRDYWEQHGRGDRLLLSFHGVPKQTLMKGDPYHCQCQKTARLLANALELSADECQLAFQSRLGKAEWLKPYAENDPHHRHVSHMYGLHPYFEIAVSGNGARETLREINRDYLPQALVAGSEVKSELPLFKGRFNGEKTHIFVCRDQVCELPVKNVSVSVSCLWANPRTMTWRRPRIRNCRML